MVEEQKILNILAEIRRNFEDLSSRKSTIISSSNSTIETVLDDARFIPDYIASLNKNHMELQQTNTDLDQKTMSTQQAIETVTAEIEINESTKSDLQATEEKKRTYKGELESKIVNSQQKKSQLEIELSEVSGTAQYKDGEYAQKEARAREELAAMDVKIQETEQLLGRAKEENKLIVYLMDAGLLDVPEAEIVSIIASYPNGLRIDEIKDKVKMPPVRVQPTINTLLENVLQYDAHSDSYKILESIKNELS